MVTIWQLFYVVGSPFIKIRICMTLIRVATQRWYTYPLYAVCGLSVAMTLMAFIAVFIQCAPFEASWTGQGKCISVEAVNIFVNWTVAIMPGFILWHLQLRRKLKLLCSGILGLGVLAGHYLYHPCAVRQHVVSSHTDMIGFIILWTVVELGLGIVAGSLPSLRKFFTSLAKDKSSGDKTSFGTDLVTIGASRQTRAERGPLYDCELNTTVAIGRDGSIDDLRDKDDDNTCRIIQVTRDFTQTST
ncbi:integral membrane protein [Ilyonectria robusta]|uniref:uncharacterized protein n=1 Tax=Ilyonectria robusta TaxID=1079257 RepID=UPI001E8E5582|nr:uncharacterized protein BGZ61DRAFT_495372 [Ilyonectria robusta]KAH8685102.1 integral membrane protein [Ilyonectria robusta]